VAGKDHVVPVHQHGHIEPKALDASRNLADLPRIVLSGILRIEAKRSNGNLLNGEFVVALWRHIRLLPKAFVMR
jgi:hypothetical protein